MIDIPKSVDCDVQSWLVFLNSVVLALHHAADKCWQITTCPVMM